MSPNVKKVKRAKVKTLRRQRVKTFKRTTQQHRLRPQTTSRTTYPLLRLLGEHQSQNYQQRERGNQSDQRGSTFLLLTLPLNIGRVVWRENIPEQCAQHHIVTTIRVLIRKMIHPEELFQPQKDDESSSDESATRPIAKNKVCLHPPAILTASVVSHACCCYILHGSQEISAPNEDSATATKPIAKKKVRRSFPPRAHATASIACPPSASSFDFFL
jgi:hypothetical protein